MKTTYKFPPTEVLVSIARLLNVSPNYLLCYDLEESYSVKGFSPRQKEVIDALFAEYTLPSGYNSELSVRQISIIQKQISSFSAEK